MQLYVQHVLLFLLVRFESGERRKRRPSPVVGAHRSLLKRNRRSQPAEAAISVAR